jgi:hypothetical protein
MWEPGNNLWSLRSKHGRDKLFETPELLWKAACEYFKWCDENPWTKEDWVGKDADKVIRTLGRPYTMQGLCLYLDCGTAYFRNFKNEKRNDSADFKSIIARIEETVYNQKFEGASVGVFNANIIARDLGLRDKTELSTPPEGEGGFNVTLKIE